jgi:hypothetical protein
MNEPTAPVPPFERFYELHAAEVHRLLDTPVSDPEIIARRASRLVIFRDGSEPERFFASAIAKAEERAIPLAIVSVKAAPARATELPPPTVLRPTLGRAIHVR